MSTSLSVIIPGYNTPNEWWERCLKSVIAALPQDGEIICVDDGSFVRPKVEVEDKRIKWIYLEKNIGQSAARNLALNEAKGEYIAFVDSDDEIVGHIYEETMRRTREEGADIGIFGVRVVWTKEGYYKEDIPSSMETKKLDAKNIQELFEGCLFEYVWNRVFKRVFLLDNSLKFDIGICPGEDTVFNLNTILNGAKFCTIPIVGYVYYRYFTSSLARYQQQFDRSLKMKNDLWKELKRKLSGGDEEVSMLGELSDSELRAWSAENVWRYDSPISFAERLRMFGAGVFLKMLIKCIIRKCFYVRAIRRMKIKKMFPQVKEME